MATGGLNVAPDAGDVPGQNWTAHVTVTGSTATLQVGQTGTNTANMVVGRTLGVHTASSHSTGRLDLSGLGTFVANVNLLSLGQGIEWGSRGYAQLVLAENNEINAKTIETSRRTGHTNVLLGQNNTIRTNTMYMNMGKAALQSAGISNEIRFQTGLTNPVLNLRGLDNEGANLIIGANVTAGTAGTSVGTMDLSGGTLNATLDTLTVGWFNYTNAGGVEGILVMDDGFVTANGVMLARTTSPAPTKTTGIITMRGGTFVALGTVEDGGGVSTINVNGGAFVSQGTLAVDNLNVGTSTSAATFQMNGLAAGSRNVDTLTLGANGNILLRANPYGAGTIVATTATLAAGSTVEIGPATGSSTAIADRSAWTAGAGTWDATQTNWSNGLPAGYTIVNGQAYTFLQAATLTNGGLALANSPDWSLNVDSTSATLTRTGGDLTTGPRRAVIDDPAADVTRADHLTVAEAAGADAAMLEVRSGQLAIGAAGDPKNLTLGSGAAAGQLLQSGGTVTVYGNVVDDGASSVNLYGGTLNVGGDFQLDNLAIGQGGQPATLNLNSLSGTHGVANTVLLASGVGSRGTLAMLGGTLNLAGGITSGGGTSSLYIDGASMNNEIHDPPYPGDPAVVTVNGDLRVGELRVGYVHQVASTPVGGKATLSVIGGAVEIGLNVTDDALRIGNRTASIVDHPQSDWFSGTADFSAATSVHIEVDRLYLGVTRRLDEGHPGDGPNTVGTLLLSQSGLNLVDANEIRLGDTAGGTGASPSHSTIVLGGADNLFRVDTLTLGRHKGSGTMQLMAGGLLDLSGLTNPNGKTNLLIGDNNVSTNANSRGVLDVSAGTFNAKLGTVVLAQSPLASTNAYATASLTMGAGSVTADSIVMAVTKSTARPLYTTALLRMVDSAGSFTVAGDITDGDGVSTLEIDAGSLTVAGSMNVDNLRVGLGGGTALLDLTGTTGTHSVATAVTIAGDAGSTGTIRMAGGTFTLPSLTDGGGTSYLDLPNGTMNLSGDFAVDNVWVGSNGGTAVLNVDGAVVIGSGAGSTLNVAVVSGGGTTGGTGTLDFADAASVAIDVGTMRIANSGHGISSIGTVSFSGGTNTIRADEIIVGNRKSAATVSMAAGGSLDIQGQTGARANLTIGRNDINTGSNPLATLDATAGVFTAQIDQLLLGHKSGGSAAGYGRGELLLGDDPANNVNVNNVLMAELNGGGTATGRLQMTGGTFTVNDAISDGGGTSTLQLDGGSMTVGNGLQVDNLRVAYDGLSADLTVSGGDAVIGTGTETFNIGSRSTVTTGSTVGFVDFSAAASVSINVAQLGLAQIPGASTGTTAGTLILPTTGPANISATVISLGDISNTSGGGLASLHLGAGTTDIDVDDFYVGYRKKDASVDILSGGMLNIAGRSGAEANLHVGYNAINTGSVTTGTMDLTGGTLNADLNSMIVGYHTSIPTTAGSGTGVLTFEAGTISANTVVVGGGGSGSVSTKDGRGLGTVNMNGGSLTAGDITLGAGSSNTSGTFNLAGGTLTAASIVQGFAGSTANFHWTDGTLHVGQFGSPALPLDLLQQGGTLAPGNSIGTTEIFGNYTQLAAGALEIEIAGLTNHDFVMVHGNTSLDGTVHVLMDGFEAQLRDSFDVLQTTGDLTLGDLGFTGDMPNPTFGWWSATTVPGPGGQGAFLRLTAVPEPASAVLALLAIAALLGRRRRR